jgi:hypothetical protein
MDINHESCPPSYKLSNDTYKIYIHMLVELHVSNYVTFDGFVNGTDGIFKASTTYCEKTII